MKISDKEISLKKKVGVRNGKPVFCIGTIGGLYTIVCPLATGGFEPLGIGSHVGMAKFLAQRNAPDIEFDELHKSEDIDPRHFEDFIPKYEALLQEIQEITKTKFSK